MLGNEWRDSMYSLAEAYASMYQLNESDEAATRDSGLKQKARATDLNKKAKDKAFAKFGGKPPWMKEDEDLEEVEILEYSISDEDAEALMEGKKKCKSGYKYDSKKKKCVKKKSSSSSKKSSKTTIIVGRGYGYGGGHHHHDDDGDKETEAGGGSNGGGAGGDGGGDGGGGGGE